MSPTVENSVDKQLGGNGIDRITVTLTTKAQAQLADIVIATGQSKTDLVNRAISLLSFVEKETEAGSEVWLRHPSTGVRERVHLL